MSKEYKYAFGQWVIDEDGERYRYLGKNGMAEAVLYMADVADTDILLHDDIRPDPYPPELVAGQLVMVRDDELDDWEGPKRLITSDNKDNEYPHIVVGYYGKSSYKYAKPYIPEPETPELEPSQLDAIRAELSDLKAHIQKIENRLPG